VTETAVDFPRHLLDIEGLTRAQIEALLTLAGSFKRERAAVRAGKASRYQAQSGRRGLLAGRTVVTLFFEASTRTRSSFETAARALGADVLSLQKEGSSVSKGETLADTARNLEAVGADAFVIRHQMAGAPFQVSRVVDCTVINAGDGAHEHPTQALLDALSLRERWGSLEGRTITIVGDIAHSRVARSGIHAFGKLGAKVRVAGPSTLLPLGIEKLGCAVYRTLDAALEGADAVMALRIQTERIADARLPSTRDYARRWSITNAHVARLPEHGVVLHPGPVNRGVEIASDVVDGPRSLVMDQVDSGVAVRMAALALCLGADVGEALAAGGAR
jgi:aspartate carbamoyltransferase catalytic subunit